MSLTPIATMPFTNQILPLGFVLSSAVLVNVSPVPVHGLVGRDEVTALEIMVKSKKKFLREDLLL